MDPTTDRQDAASEGTRATQRQAYPGRISGDMAQARAGTAKVRPLNGRLMAMRAAIALDPALRADLPTSINEPRFIGRCEALAAQQRMRRIADAGDTPSTDMVELFPNASGRHPIGADNSGMARLFTARGLPVADWRDYQKIAASIGPPGMAIGK